MGIFVFIHYQQQAQYFLVYVVPLQKSKTLDTTPITMTNKPCISQQCRIRMITTHLATVCSCDILARFAILTQVLLFHVFRYDAVLLGV